MAMPSSAGGPLRRLYWALRGNIYRRLYAGLPDPADLYGQLWCDRLVPGMSVLEVGCGPAAIDLERLSMDRLRKIAIDRVARFQPGQSPTVALVRAEASRLPFGDATFGLVVCRSVLEHLENPAAVFMEVARVLAPGGAFVLLTPNRWDYASLGAMLVPNRWHPRIVRSLTGRPESHTFPTYYRANTLSRLKSLAADAGLDIVLVRRLRAFPGYVHFNPVAFLLGIFYEQTAQRCVPLLRPWIIGLMVKPEDKKR